MIEPAYSDFERGERQALLQVRTFMATRGTREADAFCAQRLHDIMMDARHRTASAADNVGIPTGTMSECSLDTE